MGENLVTALEITVVGMSLVFAAILLLWAMMAVLMRLTAETEETAPVESKPLTLDEQELRRRAAIAAVAVALAREQQQLQPHEFPLPPTAIVSPWQSVQRGRLISQKGPRK
ncbi:MAG TPA: OadG family protein [Aggregatilineaceae bacterium]|nr:OadG family protein [Aggregatilineaceae bacterium]